MGRCSALRSLGSGRALLIFLGKRVDLLFVPRQHLLPYLLRTCHYQLLAFLCDHWLNSNQPLACWRLVELDCLGNIGAGIVFLIIRDEDAFRVEMLETLREICPEIRGEKRRGLPMDLVDHAAHHGICILARAS